MGQNVKVRVDAIPDKEFLAEIDWISPIASLVFRGGSTAEKNFPARATLKNLDDRLRPGMSSTAEIIIEREPNLLLIPVRASFDKDGKPAVYVQVGKQFTVRHCSRQAQRRRHYRDGRVERRRDRDAGEPGGSGQAGQKKLKRPGRTVMKKSFFD